MFDIGLLKIKRLQESYKVMIVNSPMYMRYRYVNSPMYMRHRYVNSPMYMRYRYVYSLH